MLWKSKIESLFKARGIWGLINGEEVKLDPWNALGLLVYERKDRWVLNFPIQSLSNNQFMSIRKEMIAKGVWKAFQKWHVDKGLVNKKNSHKSFSCLGWSQLIQWSMTWTSLELWLTTLMCENHIREKR